MAQYDVNQAIQLCKDKTFREVLPLLESLIYGAPHAKAFTTESLATAMHRIASTGASDLGEVLKDRRFQALIHEVENRLRALPQEFNNQSLANVVWAAGKLRLSHRTDLFNAVEREVLNISRRHLSAFTPQQLAAIAWGFVAADMKHPLLFAAIENEARTQPFLDDLLRKAGLLQHLRQSAVHPAAGLGSFLPAGMNGGWNQGTGSHGLGPSPYMPHAVQGNGNGGSSVLGGGPANRVPAHIAGSFMPGHAAPVHVQQHGLLTSQMQYQAQMHQTQPVIPPQHATYPNSSSPPLPQSGTAQGLGSSSAPISQASVTSVVSSSTAAQQRYLDVSNRPDVAVAAEEHKREMERKQREVLGDADSEWTCPLCIEPMDDTDISFLPCPCGYQICRLCYHRIVKNETGTCPACRAEYKEENIQKKSLPEKKKKEGDVEPGWEQPAAGKKKPNKEKKPALPAYPGFPAKVRELLLRCHEIGHVVRGELDERVLEDLKALPEKGALAVLNEFIKKDMSRIRNKCAFLHRIIQRVQQEEAQVDKNTACAASGSAVGQYPLPPQRSRASSDVGCAPKNGPAGNVNGMGSYQSKGAGGWAEKENGGGQVYGMHVGAIETNGAPEEYGLSDFGASRRTIDEYLQSRPSLQLPGAYRHNSGAGDAMKCREPGTNGMGISQQISALKLSAKEALSPAAGAAAGSRLLAMLQGQGNSSQAASSSGQYAGDWKQEKPPLFARAGGGRDQGGGNAYRGGPVMGGSSEDEELLAMIARGESAHGRCGQCGLHKFGDIDTSDGNFYCEDCWKAFESSRNETALLSMVKL